MAVNGVVLAILVALAWSVDVGLGSMVGGGGGVIRFIGDVNPLTQTIRTRVMEKGLFVENGITVMFWYKPALVLSQPELSSGKLGSAGLFFQMWRVDRANTKQRGLFTCYDYDLGACAWRLADRWHSVSSEKAFKAYDDQAHQEGHLWRHMAISFHPVNGTVRMVIDAGDEMYGGVTESNLSLIDPDAVNQLDFSQETFITIGSGEGNDYDLNGEIDEFCVFKRTMTVEEIAMVKPFPCNVSSFQHDLVLNYGFDHDDALFESIVNRPSGSSLSTVEDKYGDFLWVGGKLGEGPFHIRAGTSSVYASRPRFLRHESSDSSVKILIPSLDATTFNLTTVPTNGTLTDPSDGHILVLGEMVPMVLVNQTYALSMIYNPLEPISEPGNIDPFILTSDDLSIFGEIVTNTPPILSNSTTTLAEGVFQLYYLPGHSKYVLDADGNDDTFRVEIVDLIGWGRDAFTFYDCSNCDELFTPDYGYYTTDDYDELDELMNFAIETFPHTVQTHFRRIVVKHEKSADVFGDKVVGIMYRIHDGFSWSNVGCNWISIANENFAPRTSPGNVTLMEDAAGIWVDLAPLVKDRENDTYIIEIEQFPPHGKLYQGLDKSRLVQNSVESHSFPQWVIASPLNDATSCWDNDYCVNATIGPPNVYPAVGDFAPTWQPENMAHNMFLTVAFETPVYAKEITVYEVWSPGGVVKIEAEHYERPGFWETVWEGPESTKSWCSDSPIGSQCAGMTRYPLCAKPFKTNRIRLNFYFPSLTYWAAVDAVLLTGTEVSKGSWLLSYNMSSRTEFFYVPDPNYAGIDTLRFAASDCSYNLQSKHLLGDPSRRAEFTFEMLPSSDAPILDIVQHPAAAKCGVNGQATIEIYFLVEEPDGDPFHIEYLEKPEHGELVLVNQTELLGNRITQKGPMYLTFRYRPFCDALTATVKDKFALKVVDDGGLQTSFWSNLTVYQEDKRYATDLTVAFSHIFFTINFVIALSCAAWTILYHRTAIVRASQAEFLLAIVFGSVINSATILVISIDDRSPYADLACRLRVWLYCIGFISTIAPLFMKLYRTMLLFDVSFGVVLAFGTEQEKKQKQRQLSKTRLYSRIMSLIFIDFLLVCVWDVVDPMSFKRTIIKFDIQNQYPLESSGTCHGEHSTLFVALIAVYHICILLCTGWISAATTHIHTSFSEGKYIKYAVFSTLEIMLLSIPVVILSFDNPNTFLFTTTSVIFVTNGMLLLLVFLPKCVALWKPHWISSEGAGADYFMGSRDNSTGKNRAVISTNFSHQLDDSNSILGNGVIGGNHTSATGDTLPKEKHNPEQASTGIKGSSAESWPSWHINPT